EAGVELGVRVPLEAALEILRGPPILLVDLAFIQVAELVGGSADLVTLRMTRQQLLQQDLGAALVVKIVVPPALVFVSQRSAIKLIGLGDVLGSLERRRRHIEL